MIGEDRDPLEEFLDEDSSLLVFGCLPHGVDVEIGEDAGDLLEAEFEITLQSLFELAFGGLLTGRLYRATESSFLLLEAVSADLAGVVEIEELAASLGKPLEFSDGVEALGLTWLGRSNGGVGQLLSDGDL
jgi:hypothetical protein